MKMKTSTLGLAALLLVGGLSVPAFAASDDASFDSDYLVTQLQQKGINAVNVYEDSDNVIRAEVKLADGSTDFQYFYEDTLSPVKAAGQANTRVLSRLDTGARAPASVVDNQSLLFEGDNGDN
jgi:hypothetical protein